MKVLINRFLPNGTFLFSWNIKNSLVFLYIKEGAVKREYGKEMC